MSSLLRLSAGIDWINDKFGKLTGWLVLAAVLVSAMNAIARYGFSAGSNAWLELQWYLFGAVFLLAAGYTLKNNEHIRIYIVSNLLSQRTRNIIDLIGHVLFLAPLCILLIWLGVPFFLRSFWSGEISGSAGGLVIWPAKMLLPAGFILLMLQGVSEFIKRVAVMQGLIPEPYARGGAHSAPAEAAPADEAQRDGRPS